MVHPTLQELQNLISAMKMQLGTPTNPIPLVMMKPIQEVLTEKAAIHTQGGPMPFLTKVSDNTALELEQMEERHETLSAAFIAQLYVETDNVEKAVTFYKEVFGAKEFLFGMRREMPDVSAELNLYGIQINIYERINPNTGDKGGHILYFEDADAAAKRAVDAGAVVVREAVERGDNRKVLIRDPYGYLWFFISPAKNPSLHQILTLERVVTRMFYF